MPSTSLRVKGAAETPVVRLTDRVLREDALRPLRAHLVGRACGSGWRQLHLDLGAVEVPTAGGLGGLVALHKELRELEVELVLCNVGRLAYGVFRVTGLTGLLNLRPAQGRPA
jgi:anti-anti-sigma regulatory factor